MAYNNPFFYNRDSSIDNKYQYQTQLVDFKPIYGSTISFSSRLNFLETVDNTLKIIPASENNLNIKYNLKFLLNDQDAGNLLKTIEIAGGYKYLKFIDPSGIYKDFLGLAEDYSINKTSNSLNEITLVVSAYFKSPFFNWKTSCLLNTSKLLKDFSKGQSSALLKYQALYFEDGSATNKIDNFWFSNSDNSQDTFVNLKSQGKITKNFIYESKLPFLLKNKFDFHQLDYKNSFIQNIKHKENSNALKQFSIKYENITDMQCLSMLFFLEKKSGYRRFIYEFPIFFTKYKVFICIQWNHTFKYADCHDLDLTLVEDPNPNIKIDGNNYYIAN